MKVAYLSKHGADVARIAPPDMDWVQVCTGADGTWAPEELARLGEAEALLVWSEPVTAEVLDAAPRLRIVQRLGAGYDVLQPCFAAASRRGIPCCNVEGVNKEAVAEHAMLLILALARRLLFMHGATVRAEWPRQLSPDNPVFELAGKTLGIVGLGHTGYELARRARAFGMRIVYNDIREIDPALVAAVEAAFRDKDDLFAEADVVSISTTLNPTSAGMVDARRLARMKPTAVLVCCARGGIVDEAALREALESGRIAGAGMDVFHPEPVRPDNPLLGAPNVVLTPHVAGVTGEAMARAYAWGHDNVRRVLLRGEPPRWVLNGVGE